MTVDTLLDKNAHQNISAQNFTLSRDPNTAMQEMMSTIDALRTIYTEENDALSTADTERFMGLQDRKIAAARDYQLGAKQMIERRDEIMKADPALKQKLQVMQKEFSEISSQNLGALDRVCKGVQRLNDRIMNHVREKARQDSVNYRANGSMEQNERRLSLGLNESA